MNERIVETPAAHKALSRLTEMNVVGFRVESEHDPNCDGGSIYCSIYCPVPVQIQIPPEEIILSVLESFKVGDMLDALADLAGEWESHADMKATGFEQEFADKVWVQAAQSLGEVISPYTKELEEINGPTKEPA